MRKDIENFEREDTVNRDFKLLLYSTKKQLTI